MLTIDDLPDNDLLAIFDFFVVRYRHLDFREFRDPETKWKIEWWQSLVHVCRRWRGLVFGSPRRLDLRLYYDPRRSARKTLDVWPAFPLLIQGDVSEASVDNVVAELGHSDRLCQIDLNYSTTSQIEKLWTAMQAPFPELTDLHLSFGALSYGYVPVLPDLFLGGSASRLRYFCLDGIPFPGLPKLLLSATHLVNLYLRHIPHSGYISPEVMATCLSMLTSLEVLELQFYSPQSSPDREARRSPSQTRSVLPVLNFFWFKGSNEYLEDLVARIDTPQLYQLSVTFFNDIDFDTPELVRFVSRSSRFKAPNKAHVCFGSRTASVKFHPQAATTQYFDVKISCREPNWQLSSLAQICTASLPLLSTTVNLFIYETYNSQLEWKDGIENIEWLEFLLPFAAVKNLYLSKHFVPRIAPALQEITGGGTIGYIVTHPAESLPGGVPADGI